MKKEIINFLYDFFSKKKDLTSYDIDTFKNLNYLDEGLIDSFGVIELVCELESQFEFKFSNQAFQDDGFKRIEGLAEIVEKQKNNV